jgi:CHAD domain-containing protein
MPPKRLGNAETAGSRIVAESLLTQFTRLAQSTSGLAADPTPEHIHGARVACRRLRSLLKTFGPLLDSERVRSCRTDLRNFAGSLGAVREADVRAQLLLEVASGLARPGSQGPARLAACLEESRRVERERLAAQVAMPEWAALTAAITARARDPKLARPVAADLDTVLKLVRKTWRKALGQAGRNPCTPAELHELRLALKHCRYATEPFRELESDATRGLLRRLRKAQDDLGRYRDVVLAGEWLQTQSIGKAYSARLARRLDEEQVALRADVHERVAKLDPAYDKWRRATRGLRRAG